MKQHHFLSLLSHSFKRLGGYDLSFSYRLAMSWEYARLFYKIQSETILGLTKLSSIFRYLKLNLDRPGAIAEIGVYKGGTAKLMAMVAPNKKFYLFDTFEGMPGQEIVADLAVDVHQAGDFDDTSIEAVGRLLGNSPNLHFRKGYFPETTVGLENERFAFVHVDGDIYQTTLDALRFFYPRMTIGGTMIFDDYEWPMCPGVKLAMDEYLADKPEQRFVKNEFQAILIKE